MKIAISGKGGAGKTTLVSLLARSWADAGAKVLAIDADTAGGLARALGFPEPEKITPIIEMPKLIEERTGAQPGITGQVYKLNPKVDDIPTRFAREHQGIKLMIMGHIKSGGSGCACPENTLIKALVQHLILERDEHVIMDMEAGIEHLGRSTTAGVNALLVVVEPSLRSIDVAQRIQKLVIDIGIKNSLVVGNKIHTPEDKEFIRSKLPGLKTIGFLPFSPNLMARDRDGDLTLKDPQVDAEINRIKGILEKLSPGK